MLKNHPCVPKDHYDFKLLSPSAPTTSRVYPGSRVFLRLRHSLVSPRSVFTVLAHLGISQQAGSKASLLLPYIPLLWRKRQCTGCGLSFPMNSIPALTPPTSASLTTF